MGTYYALCILSPGIYVSLAVYVGACVVLYRLTDSSDFDVFCLCFSMSYRKLAFRIRTALLWCLQTKSRFYLNVC